MVNVIAGDGGFRVEGTFSLGYAGVFRDSQIRLKSTDWHNF